jgi:hypothetical protein
VVVSLTNTRHVNPLERGHAGWCKQNFIELTGMTRARAAAASSCHACELAVRLVSRDCCACCGAATALRGCQWAAWRAVLPLALSPAQNLDRQRWFWTAGSQRRPFKAAGDLQTRPGRRKRSAPSVCRMPIRGLWEAWLAVLV